MKARDGQLRSTELEARKGELDLAWTEALVSYKAEHPNATDADIAAFKAYWLERPERRRLTSMRTDGLTATIIDANGEAHAAYFMRETDNRPLRQDSCTMKKSAYYRREWATTRSTWAIRQNVKKQ